MPPQGAARDSGTKYHHLYPQKADDLDPNGDGRSKNKSFEDNASALASLAMSFPTLRKSEREQIVKRLLLEE
jgi:hypothetical protein